MGKTRTTLSAAQSDPSYVEWRGELLARLALARLADVSVYDAPRDTPFDLLVATGRGICFFVAVKAFSSMHRGIEDVDQVRSIAWAVSRELIEFARAGGSPSVLFLFDADTDHGRFLRLDSLREPGGATRSMTLQFPIENTIDRAGLDRLVQSLEDRPAA